MEAGAAGSIGIAVRIAVPALLFVILCLFAYLRPGVLERIGQAVARFAGHRPRAIITVATLALAGRLALIPLLPLPKPVLPDEFGHLLLAETLVSGRISNPTPPYWQHIENMFVLYQPAYQSKYPLGQATALSLGLLLFGNPFFGVWLITAAMCAVFFWMLAGWLPAPWAFAGAVLAAIRIALVSDWINTYMGGSLAALGGALTLGALPRIRKRPSAALSFVFGLGIVFIMHTRPFESILFCALTVLLLGPRLRDFRVILPIAAVIGVAGLGVVGYQNWRVTGSPMLMPYQAAKKAQGVPQGMYWQAPVPRPPLRFQRLADMYDWQLREHRKGHTLRGYLSELKQKLGVVYDFYAGYYFLPAIACALVFWRDWRIRSLAAIIGALFLWSSQYGYFYEHYFAAATAAFLMLVMYGFERMSRWRWRGLAVGACAALTLGLSSIQGVPNTLLRFARHPDSMEAARFRVDLRGPVESELIRQGGRHIVFVRSHRGMETPAVWFYNGPAVESSPIIWAQEIDSPTDREFLNYYRLRRVWVVDADAPVPRLTPYSAAVSSSLPAQTRQ